jgi:hypothetical protein
MTNDPGLGQPPAPGGDSGYGQYTANGQHAINTQRTADPQRTTGSLHAFGPQRSIDDPRTADGRHATDGPLGRVLLECASRNLSGTVHITGEPGGMVHLDRGRVVAVDTPGAPGAEVLLLRSGRVSEAAWGAAFTAAAAGGELGGELVRQRLVGAVRLEIVLRSALADAMFAVAAGQVDDCHVAVAGVSCMLPLSPGEQVRWLLAETARRLGVLATLRSQLKPDLEQMTSKATAPNPRFQLDDAQRDILTLANGRRTARDMAFGLGRGVFAVTLELDRMHSAGLLTVTGRRGEEDY